MVQTTKRRKTGSVQTRTRRNTGSVPTLAPAAPGYDTQPVQLAPGDGASVHQAHTMNQPSMRRSKRSRFVFDTTDEPSPYASPAVVVDDAPTPDTGQCPHARQLGEQVVLVTVPAPDACQGPSQLCQDHAVVVNAPAPCANQCPDASQVGQEVVISDAPAPEANQCPDAMCVYETNVFVPTPDTGQVANDSEVALVAAQAVAVDAIQVCQDARQVCHDHAGVQIDPRDVGPVKSMHDVMRWPTANVSMCGEPHEALSAIMHNIDNTSTLGSAFSGIGGDTVAWNIAIAQWARMSGKTIRHPRHVAAVEHCEQCQHELKLLPHGPRCIFNKVEGFCSQDLRDQLALETEPYCVDRLMNMCSKDGAVTTSCECVTHGCACIHPHCDGVHASFPCTDWTCWGKGRKLEGPTSVPFVIYIVLLLLLRPVWIMVENVPAFPDDILARYFGRAYEISSMVTDNLTYGLAVARTRKYIILTRRCVATLSRPLRDAHTVFARLRCDSFTWRSVMCAGHAELWAELQWAYSRPSVDNPAPRVTEHAPTETDFTQALNPVESSRLHCFITQHDVAGCVISLAQNPEFSRIASTRTTLNCILCNCHIQWVDGDNRWLTARELLLAQSWPVTNDTLASALGVLPDSGTHEVHEPVCSFNIRRCDHGLPARCRTAMTKQAGNTLCLNAVGAALTHNLLHMAPARANMTRQLSDISIGSTIDGSDGSSRLDRWRQVRRLSGSTPQLQPTRSSSCGSLLSAESDEVSSSNSANVSVHTPVKCKWVDDAQTPVQTPTSASSLTSLAYSPFTPGRAGGGDRLAAFRRAAQSARLSAQGAGK